MSYGAASSGVNRPRWRAAHSLLHSLIYLYDMRNLYEGSCCYLAMYVHDRRLFTLAHENTQHHQFGSS